jgi:hypothetical protein
MSVYTLPSGSASRADLWREVQSCLIDPPPLAAFLRDPWATLLATHRSPVPAHKPRAVVLPFPRAA